jgi:hypothetical protein
VTAAGNGNVAGHVIEEEGHRHVHSFRQPVELAGADAVRAAFVFLDVLEG